MDFFCRCFATDEEEKNRNEKHLKSSFGLNFDLKTTQASKYLRQLDFIWN